MPTPLATTAPGADRAAAAPRPHRPRTGAALGAALLGFFVITLDALVVNVALPSIRDSLGGGITGLQWVVDGYTLMFAAFLLSAGSLTDRLGARRTFGAGLLLFVAASAVCGLAPNLGLLIGARLVQGAGAAVIVPSSLALIREAFPDARKRAKAISVWALGGSAGSAAGPVAGGLLSQVDWRLIFFVNVPVGLIALALLLRTEHSPRAAKAPFDWTGQLSAVIAMGALTYAAIEAGGEGFTDPQVIFALLLAVAAAVVFALAQARSRHPMVGTALLRDRTMVLASAIGFALNVGFYGMIFLLSLYLQQAKEMSALATGLAFVPMTLLTATVSPTAAWFASRFGSRMPVITGQVAMAAGLVLLALVPASAPVWLLVAAMIPVGAGGSLAVPALTSLLLDHVAPARAGTATGVLNTSRQVGGALAVAIFGALIANPGHLSTGLDTSLCIAAAAVLLTTAASFLLRPVART
ncbi:MFS transporter [Streptomyces sp. NBC_00102]|uniref:MFS transporter n=1 Tax=Streptomyces sp. NBC_00102 TaxID=2975652 RepID=UPI00224F850C|nr:MFS transporter [Streptomyces sp. NBC_00102]MCX5395692.1 MFS transporter [Streptomyces sp. NBC_00102]